MRVIFRFLRDDAGAVTIEWVTLSSGVLVAGLLAIFAIYGTGVDAVVSDMSTSLVSLSTNSDPGLPIPLNR